MAKFYSGIDTSVGIGTETLDGMLANGSDFGVLPSKDIDCSNIFVDTKVGIGTTTPDKTFVVKGSGGNFVGEITNTGTAADNNGLFVTTANTESATILFAVSSGGSEKFRISATGGLGINGANYGTSGQILSSTGSGLNWIDASTTSVANANNVGINLDSTDADQFVAFVGSSSGNNPIRVDAGLKYNPNSNVLTTGGNIIPDADNAHDFGSSTKRWANIYSADLQLSNVGTGGNEVDGSEGSWTMQEGADDLFLINRVTGKKYKFNLTEIS